MILLDLQQTLISSLMADVYANKKEINENLLRHVVFNTIRSYKQRFSQDYGSLVICCDSKHSWRKDFYPHYKAHRKADREKRGFDWEMVYKVFDETKENLRQYFPYKVIEVPGAEADDIIGTLTGIIRSRSIEDILILSSDRDFLQLQKYKNVCQYSPTQKGMLVEFNPELYLKEHVLKGDRNDGIPNVLSPDDTFVSGKRQSVLRKENLQLLLKVWDNPKFENTMVAHNFARNKTLIDLSETPKEIQDLIIAEFGKSINNKNKSNMLNFFITNRMTNLIELIDEF